MDADLHNNDVFMGSNGEVHEMDDSLNDKIVCLSEATEKVHENHPPKDFMADGKTEYEALEEEDSEVEDEVMHYDSDIGEGPDTFFDLEVWDKIGKNLEDFTKEDMQKITISNLDMCFRFYKMYAKVKGFGVRKKSPWYSRVDGLPTSQTFVCNREGFREKKHLDRKDRKYRPREMTRCHCKAKIVFKYDDDEETWIVNEFKADHTHDLAPENQVAFIRSHREVTAADKIRIKSLINYGISPCVAMRHFVNEAGGDPHKVGFLITDMYQSYDGMKKAAIKDGDTEAMMAYLVGKQSTDASFFLRHKRDEHNMIESIFWCDGRSREDYKAFGRVIAFDSTYKTNKYEKPLVVITGVNHHRRTIPFAVALVKNETEETFRSVLEQLLEAGDNLVPYTILTDGAKAMAAAIKNAMPTARHKLCLWHLMRNLKSNTPDNSFCSGFMKCLDHCRTPELFEEAWEELVTHHKVKEAKWAIDLYNNKEKWAECFNHGYFYAGMRSTQRVESMHRTLKTVLSSKLLLYKFVELHDQIVTKIRFAEDHDDRITAHTFPVIEGVLSSIKRHAARTYTRSIYRLLCREMEYEARHLVISCEEDKDHPDGPSKLYRLNDTEMKGVIFVVAFNATLEKYFCCCAKLESVGFPCRHMFAVMKYEGVEDIPRGCIIRRWTIHGKEHCSNVGDIEALDADDEVAAVGRFAFLLGDGQPTL